MAIKEEQGTPNRPGRPGYVTTTFTGDDVRKARGLLDKQARESAEKIRQRKSTWTRKVRNYKGRTAIVSEKSETEIIALQRGNPQLYPRGPVSSRPTFQMPGYFKRMPDGTRKLVKAGDPDY